LALSSCAFVTSNRPWCLNPALLGLLFSLVGLVTVLLSTQHYFAVRRDIDEDTYEPADRWVILFSLAVMILGAGVIYFVFTVPFNPLNSFVFE
jgi:putative membrane protein